MPGSAKPGKKLGLQTPVATPGAQQACLNLIHKGSQDLLPRNPWPQEQWRGITDSWGLFIVLEGRPDELKLADRADGQSTPFRVERFLVSMPCVMKKNIVHNA